MIAGNREKFHDKFRTIERQKKVFDSQKHEAQWRKESWNKVFDQKSQFKKFKQQKELKRDYDLLSNYGDRMALKMSRKDDLLS